MAREMKNFHFFTKFGIGPNCDYYTYRSDKIVERLLGTIPKVHCNNGLFERFFNNVYHWSTAAWSLSSIRVVIVTKQFDLVRYRKVAYTQNLITVFRNFTPVIGQTLMWGTVLI